MSDYCSMTFVSKPYTKGCIDDVIGGLFDAYSIKFIRMYNDSMNEYRLTIAELNLKESIKILDAVKRRYNIRFVIEHGEY